MIKLFFKLLRASYTSNKAFSTLNILGLSVGICSSLFIYLWVVDEISYDKFYKNADNIYRIIKVENTVNGEKKSALTPAPLAIELKNDFPQILKAASIYGDKTKNSIFYNDKIFKFSVFFTSNDLFDIFDMHVLQRAANNMFVDAHSAVISSSCAEKLFGDKNPIGKRIEDTFQHMVYEVSAVIEVPKNSHLQFEIFIPFEASKPINRIRHQWNIINVVNYVQIADKASFDNQQKLQLQNFLSRKLDTDTKLYFQPVSDIHLFTDFNDDWVQNNGNIQYVRTFSTAAIFLLIVAGLNYIILSTARSEKRNKEIALKKLFGLNKYWLISQLLLETVIYTVIAQLIAGIMFLIITPYFNEFTGKSIHFQFNSSMVFYFIASILIISLLAGGYLSFYLSSLDPLNLLTGFTKKGSRYHLSTIITPLQLVISLVFIICSINIYQQLKYMHDKDKGLLLENIIAVNTQGFIYEFETIKNELLKNANIYSVTASGGPPIDYRFEQKGVDWEGKNNDDIFSFNILTVDPSFLETFGIELLQGSFLPHNMTLDGHFDGKYHFKTPIIINETALSLMGIDNPIGKKINLGYPNMNGYIAGILKDFNFRPLNYPISPMAMVYNPESFSEMFIKFNPERKKEIISYIEEVTLPFRKGKYLFDYYFIKDKLEHLYKAENIMLNFAYIFAFISVSLSILGILGMISYSITKRRKSIAIRKVYGAKTGDIIYMYIKELIVIVSIASIIASPIAWYYMHSWLENYAYHINLSPLLFIEVFIIAVIVILSLSMVIVYGESNKNPITNLHYE